MSDGLEKDQDPLDSPWITPWETLCIDEYQEENGRSVREERLAHDKECAAQKLWLTFQNSASAISCLYKEGGPNPNSWAPFQNAACSVTALYKDGIDVMKKCFEMGKCYGHHRRNDEIIAWTRKSRRSIRREELVGYICGRNPPLPSRHHRNSTSHGHGRGNNHRLSGDRSSPRHSSPRLASSSDSLGGSVDMQPFCDALALQGLNGAMSNFGIRNTGGGNTPPPSADSGAGASNADDIHNFVLGEIESRNVLESRKRASASADNVLDSPSRKRSRFL